MSAFIKPSYTQYVHEQTIVDEDKEIALINHLVEVVTGNEICRDPIDVVNFYVALKSKPLIIISGPANSGKTALVQYLAHTLLGNDSSQYQMLVGHPWTAENSDHMSFFTGVHYRFNTEKILSLVEEAWQPENRHRLFLACLAHISPAEIIDLFSSLSQQLIQEQIHRIGDNHFPKPIRYPPNLWIIGTIDSARFVWWDNELLSKSMILHWLGVDQKDQTCHTTGKDISAAQIELLSSLRRETNEVYRKFYAVSEHISQPLQRFFELKSLLADIGIPIHDSITDEIVTYLANSWTRKGEGLFHPFHEKNLSISLDLAIAQILLPRVEPWLDKSPHLRARLMELFGERSPRSAFFIESY